MIAESIESVQRIKTRLNQFIDVGPHREVLIHHHPEISCDGGRLDDGVEWTVVEIMKSTRCCEPQKLSLCRMQWPPVRLHPRDRDDPQLLDLIRTTV